MQSGEEPNSLAPCVGSIPVAPNPILIDRIDDDRKRKKYIWPPARRVAPLNAPTSDTGVTSTSNPRETFRTPLENWQHTRNAHGIRPIDALVVSQTSLYTMWQHSPTGRRVPLSPPHVLEPKRTRPSSGASKGTIARQGRISVPMRIRRCRCAHASGSAASQS